MEATQAAETTEQAPLKHSGWGIASFVTGIAAGLLLVVLVVVAGVMQASTPGGIDESSASAIIVGLGIMGACVLGLVAIGLGIAGLVQKRRRKLFAVLGVVLPVAELLGIVLLMVIGLMAE